MVIAYSNYKFLRDVLQGKAYQYWWDMMVRTPEYQVRVAKAAELLRAGALRR